MPIGTVSEDDQWRNRAVYLQMVCPEAAICIRETPWGGPDHSTDGVILRFLRVPDTKESFERLRLELTQNMDVRPVESITRKTYSVLSDAVRDRMSGRTFDGEA